MIVVIGLCLTFGIIYPLVTILVYPFYKLSGGKRSFRKWLHDM